MAIIEGGNVLYSGAVIKTWDHYWLDGMIEEYAVIWDTENHCYRTITIGYYGSDCRNLMGNIRCEVEVSREVARDIIRTIKKLAVGSYCTSVLNKKKAIEKGITAEVVRGTKVKKGTKVEVFWVGERPKYAGYGVEIIAGCFDENGNKIWIKAEYLKNILPLKSPNTKERKKYLEWYLRTNVNKSVRMAAGWKG